MTNRNEYRTLGLTVRKDYPLNAPKLIIAIKDFFDDTWDSLPWREQEKLMAKWKSEIDLLNEIFHFGTKEEIDEHGRRRISQ